MLTGLNPVNVNENLIASEKIAKRSFRLWGALLRLLGTRQSPLRKMVVVIYVMFLITLILTVVPVSALLKRLLAPYQQDKVAQQKNYYSEPSGYTSEST